MEVQGVSKTPRSRISVLQEKRCRTPFLRCDRQVREPGPFGHFPEVYRKFTERFILPLQFAPAHDESFPCRRILEMSASRASIENLMRRGTLPSRTARQVGMNDLTGLAGAFPSLPMKSLVGNWRLGSVWGNRFGREVGEALQDVMGLECRKFTGKCC